MTAPFRARIGTRSNATDGESLQWRGWRFSTGMAVITVALCFFATFWLPGLLGDHIWLQLGDAPATIQSAQFVANGGLPWVYSANVEFLPLPGFLLLLAPAVAVGDHYNLVNNVPFALAHPSMWIAVTPIFFLTGATAILGADYLADTLDVSLVRRRVIAIAMSLLVVIPTCCWTGHSEDLLCLALSSLALALMLRRRPSAAAAILAAAILIQPWAGLLVPLLLATSPRGSRLKALVYSCAAPGLAASLLLAMDFKDAYRSLVIQPMPDSHGQKLPWWSLTHAVRIVTDTGPIMVRVGSLPRTIAVVLAFGAAAAVWRRPSPRRVVMAASVALVARGVFETQLWSYYLAPGAVLMLIGAAAFTDPGARSWPVGAAATLVFYGAVAGAYDQASFSPSLALLVLLVSAGVALLTASGRGSIPAPSLPKIVAWCGKRRTSPI